MHHMKGREMKKTAIQALALTAISVLLLLPLQGQGEVDFLKGKVHYLDTDGLSLAKKFERAEQEFKRLGKGDVYFTGYTYLSKHEVHQGTIHDESRPFTISVVNGKIKRRRVTKDKESETYSTEDGNQIVGLVFLNRLTKKTAQIMDVELIDLDNTYDFTDEPIFWLGDGETEESIRFLEKEFDSGDEKLRKTLVFVISTHDHASAYDFLHRVALGNYETEVRENAIFWLGNSKDERSLKDLKAIYKKVDEDKLKKQVVFAFQMSDRPEAIQELIHIAKKDNDQKIRKEAIFWLGQKASEECVKVLKDVVDDSDEETKVKESAVFAISQLPQEKSVPMLIDIARTNKNPKVKKQAIFWLGQTDDEAALKFFEDILLKR
jgi:ribosomal protein L10